MTRTNCGQNFGYTNEIGFKIDSRIFIPLFEVCYNNDTASVIYSKHYINGKAIQC